MRCGEIGKHPGRTVCGYRKMKVMVIIILILVMPILRDDYIYFFNFVVD